jgi:hypothetical protein
MRGKTLLFLLGVTALGAYTVGRSSSPVNNGPMPAVAHPMSPVARSVAFTAPGSPPVAKTPSPSPFNNPAPTTRIPTERGATVPAPENATPPDIKRKAEFALTAAAIAAIIIKASRDRYYASGRPCACPDDTMRNGSGAEGRLRLKSGGAFR